MNPLLSIVVPVYNVESYLRYCIDSVIKQDSNQLELILVDDGSTDCSLNICKEYSRKYEFIKTFHQENAGPSKARNLGLAHATGDYISFLDADDFVSADYFSVLSKYLGKVDLIFFCHKEVYADGSEIIYKLPTYYSKSKKETDNFLYKIKDNLQKIEFANFTWNKCFKRSVIEDNGITFVEGLNTREDEIFTNKYCKYCSTLIYIPDCIYNYRIVGTGLTSSKKSYDQIMKLVFAMMNSIGWQNYPLRNYSINRINSFFIEGSCLSPFSSLPNFKKLYRYNKNNRIDLNGLSKLCFGHNFAISCIMFYLIIFFKCLIRGIRNAKNGI